MDTSPETVAQYLEQLNQSKRSFVEMTLQQRIALVDECAEGVAAIAQQWVDAACQAKRIPDGSPARAEEVFAGPVAVLRYLRLLAHSLRGIEESGIPHLPGKAYLGSDGRLRVPLLPTGLLYDRLALFPFRVTARMRKGVGLENLSDCLATAYRDAQPGPGKTVVVLGAGNVSAIPLTDSYTKMFQEGSVVLLKMSPVNEYLGRLFELALQPLIRPGYLRLAYGGAEVGEFAVNHPLTDAVHITGALHSHEQIVWGPAGVERENRISEGRPLLQKDVTSELGSVSPWIFHPGEYTPKQIAFQAENVAASVTNNVSFNCIATKVLITWKRWPLRTQLLDRVEEVFAGTPPRYFYYPGAVERYRKFAEVRSDADLTESPPWVLIRDVAPDEKPKYFREESFVCVLVEVALDAETPELFLQQAVTFANERLLGNLSAAITIPKNFRSSASNEQSLQAAVAELKYGMVAINHWPGLMYAMMSPPWGGFPGNSLADPQSGIGAVHNTFMLEGVEQAVMEGPLTITPKPPWFPSCSRRTGGLGLFSTVPAPLRAPSPSTVGRRFHSRLKNRTGGEFARAGIRRNLEAHGNCLAF